MFKLTMEFSTIEELLTVANSIAGTSQSIVIDPMDNVVESGYNPVPLNIQDSITATAGDYTYTTKGGDDTIVVSPNLDAEGTPWDERIHAGTKTMSAKGIWKKKRGVDDEVFDAVMAELQGGGINLLDRIISQFVEGNLSVFTVQDLVTELGIASLNDASGNPEMIETIAERLGVE